MESLHIRRDFFPESSATPGESAPTSEYVRDIVGDSPVGSPSVTDSADSATGTTHPPKPPLIADERTMLDAWLDLHRDILVWKCEGLSPDQLVQRSTEPSIMSLIGLLRHMAEVERGWF